jgi:uncharacterized phiE125 gp8 family phage protein
MGLVLYTAPSCEPVTVEELRTHARISGSDDDELLSGLIAAARQIVEQRTQRAIIQQTWHYTLDQFPADGKPIYIPHPPLGTVSSITYVDYNGTTQTLAATVYTVQTRYEPGRIVLAYDQSWPEVRDQEEAITIAYVAGYTSTATTDVAKRAAVPEGLKLAVKLLAAH